MQIQTLADILIHFGADPEVARREMVACPCCGAIYPADALNDVTGERSYGYWTVDYVCATTCYTTWMAGAALLARFFAVPTAEQIAAERSMVRLMRRDRLNATIWATAADVDPVEAAPFLAYRQALNAIDPLTFTNHAAVIWPELPQG